MGKIYKNGILFAGSTDNAKSVAFDNTDTGLEADNVQEAIEEVDNKLNDKSINYSILLDKKHIPGNVQEIVSLSDEITKYKYVSFIFYWNNTTVYSQQTYPTTCFGSIIKNVVLFGGNNEKLIQVWPKNNTSIYVQMSDNTYISLSVVVWN